jgi:ankyrin repeat protein
MLTLRGDDPQALALRQQIEAGRVEELSETLACNPALARAVVLDAKGHGRSLLHIATDWPGHFPNVARTIAALAAAGADLNAPFLPAEGETLHRETPLHWAASSNDLAAIEALLAEGADIEAPGAVFTGGTAMSDAVIFAQWDAARMLLARGARTTFTQAAALGLRDRLSQIFGENRPSAETITAAFWHACRAGQREAAGFLLEHGAELNWIGWDHLTPLDAAQKSSHTELAAWLLAQGAKCARELAG